MEKIQGQEKFQKIFSNLDEGILKQLKEIMKLNFFIDEWKLKKISSKN